MKEFKTFNQQLNILRQRGLIVPTDGKPKRFLEEENYYNVINGYKDLFYKKALMASQYILKPIFQIRTLMSCSLYSCLIGSLGFFFCNIF